MSWEDQGRQDHGWFGHGTAPAKDAPSMAGVGALFAPDNVAARIDAIAYSAIAHMSRADQTRDSVAFDRPRLERLRAAMGAWMNARSLSQAAFGERFVDPSTSVAAIEKLRSAAEVARKAATHDDLADASADLADAMRRIGLARWSRFLDDAARRAEASELVGRPNLTPSATPIRQKTVSLPIFVSNSTRQRQQLTSDIPRIAATIYRRSCRRWVLLTRLIEPLTNS